jgi:photosystem II stability/assembly factor-like uncharacterized protein
MTTLVIASGRSLLVVREADAWQVERHPEVGPPDSIAVDPIESVHLYAGTLGAGLWRSADAGRTWSPVGGDLPHDVVTAVAVDPTERGAVLYAGTEPSTISRSDDGGDSWRPLPALLELPSADHWSFPPKPDTHHVRWIETDPHRPNKLYVAIEAGALVRSEDGGETWTDRVAGGPIDTHTLAAHPTASGRLYSAAGDGYFESRDGGDSWTRMMDGLRHRYLVSVAVDPAEPETVVVSAASGPHVAYSPANAEAYIYRKAAGAAFELAMDGLPAADGTVTSRLATAADEPGVFYAANNHGVFRSQDGGRSWRALPVDWPPEAFGGGVAALAVIGG